MSERRSVPLEAVAITDRHRKTLGDLASLTHSMDRLGLLQPIVVTPDMRLIAGQRRLEAARTLGWKAIQAYVIDSLDTATALLEAERDENVCRLDMKVSERVGLGRALEGLERPRAAKRQGNPGRPRTDRSGDLNGTVKSGIERGDVREIVGDALGMAGSTYGKAKKVVEAAESGDATAKTALAEMDASGKVEPAYRKIARPVSRNGSGPKPVVIETERQRQLAGRAKQRAEKAVGNCNALGRGLKHIDASLAVAVTTSDELKGWDAAFRGAQAAISQFRKRIKEAG